MKSAIRNYAFLFFGSILFHLVGAWNLPLIDRDEPRFAEASREMIQRGDYVVPHFNNQLRLDKPPLAYWAQAGSYHFFGENDLAARLPSAIAAALIATSIFAWGSRIGGTKLGWWAAIIFALSLQTFLHAKAAVADMWLVLFVTLAHWAGYELLCNKLATNQGRTSHVPAPGYGTEGIEHRTLFWRLIFYLALAFGFLAKGPIGWTPMLTVLSTRIFLPEAKLNQRFRFLLGSFSVIAIVALWGIPALIRTRGEFFAIGIGRHVIGRSFATMEGHGANSFGMYLLLLPFYFVTVFISFCPWSIKLPWLTSRLWRRRDNVDNYLITGVVIIFIIFTFVKTKLPHYTLPALPLLGMLLARISTADGTTRFLRKCAIASASVYLAIALVVPTFVAKWFPARELYRKSNGYLRPKMQFGSVEFGEPSLVWYFRGRVNGFLEPLNDRRVTDFMAQTGPRFVIVPTSLATTLFQSNPETWQMFSTSGFNIAKGKHVDLTLILKPD